MCLYVQKNMYIFIRASFHLFEWWRLGVYEYRKGHAHWAHQINARYQLIHILDDYVRHCVQMRMVNSTDYHPGTTNE